jgi:hypothetical protein
MPKNACCTDNLDVSLTGNEPRYRLLSTSAIIYCIEIDTVRKRSCDPSTNERWSIRRRSLESHLRGAA